MFNTMSCLITKSDVEVKQMRNLQTGLHEFSILPLNMLDFSNLSFLHYKMKNCIYFSFQGQFFLPLLCLPLLVQALSECTPCQALAMPASWQVNERSHRSSCFFPGDTPCPHSVTIKKLNKMHRTSKTVHYGLPGGAQTPLRNGISYK